MELWVERLRVNDSKSAPGQCPRPIVLLVDEYDWLLTHTLDRPALGEEIARLVLAPFFGATKMLDAHFHKVFVTGVSKFSLTSVFSGANQYIALLQNDAEFCSLYGFTEVEIDETYAMPVCVLAHDERTLI